MNLSVLGSRNSCGSVILSVAGYIQHPPHLLCSLGPRLHWMRPLGTGGLGVPLRRDRRIPLYVPGWHPPVSAVQCQRTAAVKCHGGFSQIFDVTLFSPSSKFTQTSILVNLVSLTLSRTLSCRGAFSQVHQDPYSGELTLCSFF